MTKPDNTDEFSAFVALTNKLLSVSHGDIQKQVEKHKADAAANPRKRGPKPRKAK